MSHSSIQERSIAALACISLTYNQSAAAQHSHLYIVQDETIKHLLTAQEDNGTDLLPANELGCLQDKSHTNKKTAFFAFRGPSSALYLHTTCCNAVFLNSENSHGCTRHDRVCRAPGETSVFLPDEIEKIPTFEVLRKDQLATLVLACATCEVATSCADADTEDIARCVFGADWDTRTFDTFVEAITATFNQDCAGAPPPAPKTAVHAWQRVLQRPGFQASKKTTQGALAIARVF